MNNRAMVIKYEVMERDQRRKQQERERDNVQKNE